MQRFSIVVGSLVKTSMAERNIQRKQRQSKNKTVVLWAAAGAGWGGGALRVSRGASVSGVRPDYPLGLIPAILQFIRIPKRTLRDKWFWLYEGSRFITLFLTIKKIFNLKEKFFNLTVFYLLQHVRSLQTFGYTGRIIKCKRYLNTRSI